jgi:pimeloyl-ACP methyl ester carboxylesterase
MARELAWASELRFAADGPRAALFFGGFGASPEPWRPLALRLQRDGWSVLVSALGRHTGDAALFHRSRTWHYYADALRRLRRLGQERHAPVLLGGYSTGALIALLLAARYPERVAGLVLVSPVLRTAKTQTQLVGYSFGSLYYVGLPLAMLATTLALAARARSGGTRMSLLVRALASTSIVAAAALGMRNVTVPLRSGGPMLVDGEEVLPPHFQRVSLVTGSTLVPLQLVARRRLPDVSAPTCVVFGSEDDVVDVEFGVAQAARLRHAEAHVVPGAPHRVVVHPLCVDVVAEFAATLPIGRTPTSPSVAAEGH